MAGDSSTTPDAPRELVAAGTRIGRYEIVRPLGAGGMGVVLAARDHELDRMVALKLLRSADQEAAAPRLAREGKALAKLTHPNVVTVYDIGRAGDTLFIAMELIDGETLRAWLEREPRARRDVVRVLVEAARGLAAAHNAGLVHRDFKPDNVLIDRQGHARVTDFGLARVVGAADAPPADASSDAPDAITRTDALAGTPPYMAPEQILGRPVDARTDQWSFGVTLYEALAGKRPFGGEVPTGADPLAVLLADATAGRQTPLAVPGWLARVVRRCLEVDPARRHPSMDAVAKTLERGLGRRRRAVAAGAITAVAAVVGAAFIWSRPAAPPARWNPVLLAREHPGNPGQIGTASRDGSTLVFASHTEIRTERRGGGGRRTFPLPEGIEDIAALALSDGGERAFLQVFRSSREEIWEIDLGTGTPTQRWPTSEPRPPALAYGVLDVALDGATLLVATEGEERPEGNRQLWRLDSSGHRRAVGDPWQGSALLRDTRWSPDGRRIARSGKAAGAGTDLPRVEILDAKSGRLLERLPRHCYFVDWLTSASLACVTWMELQAVIYELRLGNSGDARLVYVGAPYQSVGNLRTTQAGVFFSAWSHEPHLKTLDLGSKTLRTIPAGTLTDTQAGWTSDGNMVFAGQIEGRFTLMSVRPDGPPRIVQETSVAEIPLCILGYTIIFGRFPDGERTYPWGQFPDREVTLFRRTLASAPVALGSSNGFVDLLCAGDRTPPCYLAEYDGGHVRLVEWSPDTGIRGREVLRWPAADYLSSAALSPEGRFVARPLHGGAIERLAIDGGERTSLPCRTCGVVQYLTWAPDGNLVATDVGRGAGYRLFRILPDGTAEVLAESDHLWFKEPRVSPDGKTIAVLVADLTASFWWVPTEDARSPR